MLVLPLLACLRACALRMCFDRIDHARLLAARPPQAIDAITPMDPQDESLPPCLYTAHISDAPNHPPPSAWLGARTTRHSSGCFRHASPDVTYPFLTTCALAFLQLISARAGHRRHHADRPPGRVTAHALQQPLGRAADAAPPARGARRSVAAGRRKFVRGYLREVRGRAVSCPLLVLSHEIRALIPGLAVACAPLGRQQAASWACRAGGVR